MNPYHDPKSGRFTGPSRGGGGGGATVSKTKGGKTKKKSAFGQTLAKEKRIKDTYRQWNIKAANAKTKAERTLAKASAKAWKKANPGLL